MARAKTNSIPATDQPLDRACDEVYRVWIQYVPHAEAIEQSNNFRCLVRGTPATSTNTDLDSPREHQTGRQLASAVVAALGRPPMRPAASHSDVAATKK
jgi:hypothetical protein